MTQTAPVKYLLTVSTSDGLLEFVGVNELVFPAGSVSISSDRKAIVSVASSAMASASSAAIDGKMAKASNLSDVLSVPTARTNLGLGNVDNTSDANKPVSTAQAAAIALKLSISSLDDDVLLAANSSSLVPTQHAVKNYVDNLLTGLSWKNSVRVATTGNGTLATAFANGQVVDGVTLVTGDRILLKNQTTASQNGIYVVAASGAPTRATDADSGTELISATVLVREGTANADTQWTCTNDAITIGSTSIVFAQVSGSGTYTAGSGLTLTANSFSISAGAVTNSMLAGSIDLTSKVTGLLPIANGGTGTGTAFTAGSVLFAGASGVYGQDNANFFWDATNHRLGIGTASPNALLSVHVATNVNLTVRNRSGNVDLLAVTDNDAATAPLAIWGSRVNIGLNGGVTAIGTNTGAAPDATAVNTLSVNGRTSIGAGYLANAAPTNGLIVQGSVGIGTTTPAASALLELSSTVGALLVTRMTTTQKNALTAVNGMILYDSTLGKFQGYEAGVWTNLI